MSDTKRWVHPLAMALNAVEGDLRFASDKSLARDTKPFRSQRRHHFNNGLQNSRANLLDKIRELLLHEALDDSHTPRHRHNHSQRDLGSKMWDRMIRYEDSIAWKVST